MKRLYNIISITCFVYFCIMLFLDVNFVIHNEENVVSGIPLLYENLIYIILMAIPFLILLSIC
ncbi:MAG: hypothetical protein UIM26_09775, partial [Longicatena sp.]|nr:hypothetical protein [Longicatena sp.]